MRSVVFSSLVIHPVCVSLVLVEYVLYGYVSKMVLTGLVFAYALFIFV